MAGEPRASIIFDLPVPHPSTSLGIPQALSEMIEAAQRVELPEIRSRGRQPVLGPPPEVEPGPPSEVRPEATLQALGLTPLPGLPVVPPVTCPMVQPAPPGLQPGSPSTMVAPMTPIAPPVAVPPLELISRPGLVPLPTMILPRRGVAPTSTAAGGIVSFMQQRPG